MPVTEPTDSLDRLLQFLVNAAQAVFALSWAVLWAYWSWLTGWALIGIPLALVMFSLALAKTIRNATREEQFHPATWFVIVCLYALPGMGIRRTQTPAVAVAENAKRQASQTASSASTVRVLTNAAQRDDVAAMIAAIRQAGRAEISAAASTVALVLRSNYASPSPVRRSLAMVSIEALSDMRAVGSCSLLEEISTNEPALAETADRAIRNVCDPATSPANPVAGTSAPATTPSPRTESELAAASPPLPSTTANAATLDQDTAESGSAAARSRELCAADAERFWHRYGFDEPIVKAPSSNLQWSYSYHYNTELGRCLIAVRLQTKLPDGSLAVSTDISDSMSGADRPMATLVALAMNAAADPQPTALLKYGQRLEPTRKNVEWFHDLMRT